MALSEADRAALRERAAGLRAEVSSLSYERDAAVAEASATVDDQALLDEVARLELEHSRALADRDQARGTVADAMAAMEAAAEKFDVVVEPPVNVNPEPLLDPAPVVLDEVATPVEVDAENTEDGEGV